MNPVKHTLAVAGVLTAGLLWWLDPAGASTHVRPSQVKTATLACFRHHDPNERNAPRYVGLSASKAEERARSMDDTYRTIAKDGHCSTITADLNDRRVDFWVSHGRVIEARIF
jgi:hypothetical protein